MAPCVVLGRGRGVVLNLGGTLRRRGVCEHEGASLYIRLDLEIRSQRDGQISTSKAALPRY